MTHTPMCKACGSRHYNFSSCPGRRGSARPRFNDGAKPWGQDEVPEGVLVNGATPWKPSIAYENVRHLPRVPQDDGPKAA